MTTFLYSSSCEDSQLCGNSFEKQSTEFVELMQPSGRIVCRVRSEWKWKLFKDCPADVLAICSVYFPPFVFNTHKFPQSQISICKWRILPGSAAWLFSMLLEGGESAYHFLQMKLNCLPGSQSVRLSVSLSVPLSVSLSFCPSCCPCSSS